MCAMCKANQQAAEREQGAAKARVDAQRNSETQAHEAALAQAATMRAQDYTPGKCQHYKHPPRQPDICWRSNSARLLPVMS